MATAVETKAMEELAWSVGVAMEEVVKPVVWSAGVAMEEVVKPVV